MFNTHKINAILNKAFQTTADAYGEAQKKAMEAVIYPWDGTVTYRKSGEIVDSPRDIVDTGELRDSLVEIKAQAIRSYLYLASHSADVHEGYVTDGGNSKPARAWTKIARERYIDLERTMAEEIRRNL